MTMLCIWKVSISGNMTKLTDSYWVVNQLCHDFKEGYTRF